MSNHENVPVATEVPCAVAVVVEDVVVRAASERAAVPFAVDVEDEACQATRASCTRFIKKGKNAPAI